MTLYSTPRTVEALLSNENLKVSLLETSGRHTKRVWEVSDISNGITYVALELTKGFITSVDKEDLEITLEYNWSSQAIRDTYVKATSGTKGKPSFLHQLICPILDGYTPDHGNRNALDNRRVNLTLKTRYGQIHNRSIKNKTGYLGLKRIPNGSYRAEIRVISGQPLFTAGESKFKHVAAAKHDYCKALLRPDAPNIAFNFTKDEVDKLLTVKEKVDCVRRVTNWVHNYDYKWDTVQLL